MLRDLRILRVTLAEGNYPWIAGLITEGTLDSRGYSCVQMAEVRGNIGGDHRLFFQGAPFTFEGKMVRLNHTIYLAERSGSISKWPKARAIRAH